MRLFLRAQSVKIKTGEPIRICIGRAYEALMPTESTPILRRSILLIIGRHLRCKSTRFSEDTKMGAFTIIIYYFSLLLFIYGAPRYNTATRKRERYRDIECLSKHFELIIYKTVVFTLLPMLISSSQAPLFITPTC